MSATQIIDNITIFQGAQGKYYVVNGKKYHIRFPMEWAHTHKAFKLLGEVDFNDGSGPEYCGNCDAYGSIRGVFVGYCSGCLENYIDTNEPRGRLVAPGLSVGMLENDDIWHQYPYMYNVKKSEIGDEEGAEVTDNGINLERLAEAIASTEADKGFVTKYVQDNAFTESLMDECVDINELETDTELADEIEKAYIEFMKKNKFY